MHFKMYSENLARLLFLILSFISSGKLCKWHSPINVLEEEYFSFCCSKGQDKGQVAYWYKEKQGEQVLIHGESRIDLNGTNLRFWPVLLNDTGIYNCCLGNGTQEKSCKEWSLNVIKKNKKICFTEDHILTGRVGIVGRGYSFTCSDTDGSENVVDIIWYKNCIENINKRGEEKWYIDQLTKEDGGKYTCVKTVVHAGKRYNSTSTTNLNVKDTEEDVTPKLIGPDHNVLKTEIGKEETLNCKAFLGYLKTFVPFQYELYWIWRGDTVETCQKNSSLCQMEEREYDEDGKKYAVRQLWFKSVKEEEINSSYKCTFSENSSQQTFIFQKELNPDLPVPAFTTGMIMAILFSFVAVILAILCAVFKIELVLFFRDIMRKDETLGDGKLYDAFVSYLKDSTSICGEERKFALEILPKILEDHFGYKLCIFERDISPGGAVVDDVQSFIDRSRRLIIILSQNYISDQVMFELEVGLHKALVERKIKVILIEYTPKSYFDFLPMSLELLSSSQVVKWKEEKSLLLNSKFWKKLRYAMPAKPIMSAVCQGVTLQEKRKGTSAFCIPSKPSLASY